MKKSVLPLGRTLQAIVSVTAVKIQFNSPIGVFLSVNFPGMLSNRSMDNPSNSLLFKKNHLNAVLIGVVKQEVKKSAGKFGFVGNISLDPQEPKNMFSSKVFL
jgi:hypothetical protein